MSEITWRLPGSEPPLLKSATIILTDEQIKAAGLIGLGALGPIVVPGVSGKLLFFMGGYALLDSSAGAYGGINNLQMLLTMERGEGFTSETGVYLESYDGAFGDTGIALIRFNRALRTSNPISTWDMIGNGSNSAIGKDIRLAISADSGDGANPITITDGDPANTLKVTVYYVEVEL